MPDCLPRIPAIVKRYALAIGRRLPQAPKDLKQVQAVLERRPELAQADEAGRGLPAAGEAQGAEGQRP
jgi:hypothetical protein